jgi:hypothetical protein
MAVGPRDPHSVAAAEIALNALFAKYRAADMLFEKFREHNAWCDRSPRSGPFGMLV